MATFDFYRSEGQDDVIPANNGGYPITTLAPASGTFPTITSARDLVAEKIYRFVHGIYTGGALLGRRLIFDQPDKNYGDAYFTMILCDTQYETESELVADIGNRRQYGVGWLSQDLVGGVSTTATVTYKARAMIDGDAQCLYADGATLTDNIHIDWRSVGNTTDTGPEEEATVVSVGAPVDNPDGTSTVVLTLSAAVTNSYTAGGAVPVKIQTFPDKVDYEPVIDSKDDTNGGTATLDLSKIVGNDRYTWADLITIDITSPTTYSVTSQEFGGYAGQGSIGTDFLCTNASDSYFAEESFTIQANALGGTLVAGQQFKFRTHYQGSAVCMIMHKPANSAIVLSPVKVAWASEGASV